jgi:hypothetical protein
VTWGDLAYALVLALASCVFLAVLVAIRVFQDWRDGEADE